MITHRKMGRKVPHKKTEQRGNFPVSHKTWPNEGGSNDRPLGGAKNNYKGRQG